MNKSNQKSQVTKVIINIVLVLVACALAIPLLAYAQGPVIELTEDGKVPGKPFQVLQQQIDDLQNQINSHDGSDTTKTGYYVVPGPINGVEQISYREGPLLRSNKGIILPDGATVVKLSLQVYDNDTKDASITLGYTNDPESLNYWPIESWSPPSPDNAMASIVSSGTSLSWQTLETTDISNAVIDNQNNIYNIWIKWPSWEFWDDPNYPDVKGAKVVIEYTYN